jgi:hypothetical protein
MHPILITKRPDRSLALGGMPLIHRVCAKTGTHERTLARQGQRTVCDVAEAIHDGLFSDGLRWIIKRRSNCSEGGGL